jgi:hypothetical protein
MDKKKLLKKSLNLIGNAITLLAIYFVFKKLMTSELDYSILLREKNILVIAVILLILSLIIITNCFPWKSLVQLFSDKKIPWRESIQVYTKSNILKYIPGNVFQYVGRNQLALKMNLSHIQVATATMFDIALNVLAAVVLSIIYFLKNGINISLSSNTTKVMLFSFLLLCIVALFVAYKFRSYFQKFKYLLTWNTVKTALVCLIYYIFTMIIQSLLFMVLLLYILKVDLNADLFLQLFSAYTFSWLVGFLTPGAPAGIGIREAVMASATGGLINTGTITFAMIIFRVLTTLADGIALLIVTLYNLFLHKKIE